MNDSTSKSRIFISYSHRGNGPRWKNALLSALHVFEKHHLLDVWQDGHIRISSFWDDDIKEAMRSARLAVVLLTDEALKSEYILRQELPYLAERQRKENLAVFPVICEPCNWKAHDWLRATQAPNGSNPLSDLAQEKIDGVFRHLATEIAEKLSHNALSGIVDSEAPAEAARVDLDRFPLTRGSGLREEKLIGREQELALLDLAFAQPHTAIVSLVAWGGVGKTMLVQHWLQRLQREGWFGARRVYAWSFYSQGTKEDRQASEDTFLAHALEWFGVPCEPTLPASDKGRLLADAIARERTLLILDGIEPLQYPPGPMGGRLRALGVPCLLKQLARKANRTEHGGLCLVTTREPLTDLSDFERREGAAWGSVLRVDLSNLTEEAGAALLHHAGAKRAGAAEIKASDTELRTASRQVDGHALTLKLLGRFLARAHGGDIRRRDLVKFEEADRKEQGGTTFKMLAAFENWFAKSGEFGARQLAILRMLGLFDRPADAGCIAALRKPPVIAGLTDSLFTSRPHADTHQATAEPVGEEDWNTATSFLADFGLLNLVSVRPEPVWGYDKQAASAAEMLGLREPTEFHAPGSLRGDTIEAHPLIREYFANALRKQMEGWRLANWRLYDHLKTCAPFWPVGLDGLGPLFHSTTHGCQAGCHQEVCEEVLFDRIRRGAQAYSTDKLRAFASDLTAFSCFYEKPWQRVRATISDEWGAWILHESAVALRALGRVLEAREPHHASVNMVAARGDYRNAANGAASLSVLELLLGELDEAVAQAQRGLSFAGSAQTHYLTRWGSELLVITEATYANALQQAGLREEAGARFRAAEKWKVACQPNPPFLISEAGSQFCEWILTPAERQAWRAFLGYALPQGANRGAPQARKRNDEIGPYLSMCGEVTARAGQTRRVSEANRWPLEIALDRLVLGRASLFESQLLNAHADTTLHRALFLSPHLDAAVEGCRHAGDITVVPVALLPRAWLRFLEGDTDGALADLDEAWDIAERGPMRLHMADIHLHRARLFFREKPYPWKSPQDDLAAAEKLINDCGYHRRDEELADAKLAILGT